jgi:hypothetical protein
MRLLTSLVLAAALGSFAMAAPKRLTSFTALMSALNSGHEVAVVVDYAKTVMVIDGKEEPAPKAIGGMTFSPWEFFEKGVVRNDKAYVVSSETHMIAHPRYGYVNNYVRMRIYDDNSVEIVARYLTLEKQEVVMDETFKGKISSGKDKEGVALFAR